MNSIFHMSGHEVDCRFLTISIEFYELESDQVCSLFQSYVNFVNDLQQDFFVSSWRRGNMAISNKTVDQLIKSPNLSSTFTFSFDALLKTDAVHTKRALASAMEKMKRDALRSTASPMVSNDYPYFWNTLFAEDREANEAICRKIHQLFLQESKIFSTINCNPDMSGTISCSPYSKNPSRYYGNLDVQVSSFCLGDMIQTYSNSCLDYLQKLAVRYVNLNGRIMLQPRYYAFGNTPYRKYFDGYGFLDGSHIGMPYGDAEWYHGYYVPGVEWVNVLGPQAIKHIDNQRFELSLTNEISCNWLSKESLLIQSTKSITGYNVKDALIIKEMIYSAIRPGCFRYPLRLLFRERRIPFDYLNCPRSDWAIVPVFAEEIKIIGNELLISSI